MTQTAPSPSRLPETLRAGLDAYARRMEQLAGDRLAALAVFGTVLTPEWRPGLPIHQVVVLAGDDLALIRGLAALGADAARLGLAAPLLLTPPLVRSSLDTFPLEWLEIGSCHELLSGTDLFRDLALAHEHVRLQCERESIVLAIALRQRLLRGTATAGLQDLAEQAIRVLRGLLHLAGDALPTAPSAIIAAAQQRLGIDLEPIARAWTGATGEEELTGLHRVLVALNERSDHG